MNPRFFAFSSGVLFAALLGIALGAGLGFALCGLGLAVPVLCFVLIFGRPKSEDLRQIAVWSAAGFGAMALYFSLYTGIFGAAAEKYSGFSGEATLTVTDFPSPGGELTARIITDGKPSPYLVRLSNYSEISDLTPGSRITADISLTVPENTLRFSSQRYLRADNIYLSGYVTEIYSHDSGSAGLFNWHKHLRHWALERINLLYGEKAYLMRGLLFGDKSEFDPAFTAAASSAGVSHIFAVSGMHLSFCVWAVLKLGRRKWTHAAAIGVVLVFMAVTGFQPSVVRAGVMQIAALLAWLWGRESSSFGSMFFSLLILLGLNPCAAGDIGLQFSFCAVLGILVGSEKLKLRFLEYRDRLPKKLRRLYSAAAESVAVSFCATVFTAPLAVFYFDRLSLVSLLSNVVINWLVSVVFILGMVSLILSCIWLPLGNVLARVNSLGVDSLEFLINCFGHLPLAVLGAKSAAVKLSVALSYASAAVFYGLEKKRALLKTAAVSLGAIGLALGICWAAGFGSMRLTAVDGGKRESVLFSHRGNHVALDAGGDGLFDAMQNRNVPALDLLILTNVPDPDESFADELLNTGKVRRLALAAYSGKPENAEALLALAEENNIPVDVLSADRSYEFGDMVFTVMVPASGADRRGTAAVICDYRGARILSPGLVDPDVQEEAFSNRGIGEFEVLLLPRGGKAAYNSAATLYRARNIAVILGNRGKNAPAEEFLDIFEENGLSTYYVSDCGDMDFLFRRGRIYVND